MWGSVYFHQKERGKPFFANFAVICAALYLVATVLVYLRYSSGTALFFLIQAFMGHVYSLAVNYVQHYAMVREKLESWEYERVRRWHSWDTPYRFSNYLLLKAERHSDHHENSTLPYQTLSASEEAAQMPHGYILES